MPWCSFAYAVGAGNYPNSPYLLHHYTELQFTIMNPFTLFFVEINVNYILRHITLVFMTDLHFTNMCSGIIYFAGCINNIEVEFLIFTILL